MKEITRTLVGLWAILAAISTGVTALYGLGWLAIALFPVEYKTFGLTMEMGGVMLGVIFLLCFVGMLLWEGSKEVGKNVEDFIKDKS